MERNVRFGFKYLSARKRLNGSFTLWKGHFHS